MIENSANMCTHASLSFLLKHCEPQSSNDKPSLSIGTVTYAYVCVGQPLSKQLYIINYLLTASEVLRWMVPVFRTREVWLRLHTSRARFVREI